MRVPRPGAGSARGCHAAALDSRNANSHQNESARLAARNHLVDVVRQIAQAKGGRIVRPVAARGNRRHFDRTAEDQRRRDGGSSVNLCWLLMETLKPAQAAVFNACSIEELCAKYRVSLDIVLSARDCGCCRPPVAFRASIGSVLRDRRRRGLTSSRSSDPSGPHVAAPSASTPDDSNSNHCAVSHMLAGADLLRSKCRKQWQEGPIDDHRLDRCRRCHRGRPCQGHHSGAQPQLGIGFGMCQPSVDR